MRSLLLIPFLFLCIDSRSQQLVDTATGPVKLLVLDAQKKPVAGEKVKMLGRRTKKVFSGISNAKGEVKLRVLANDKYEIYMSYGGMDQYSSMIIIPPLYKGEVLDEMTIKVTAATPVRIELSNIPFDSSKAVIKKDAEKGLLELLDYLKRKPQLKIVIEAFADSSGLTQENKTLADQRSEAIRKWLLAKGIKADRMKIMPMSLIPPDAVPEAWKRVVRIYLN